MASPLNSINLIRTKTGSSHQYEAIEASLKKTGYIGLIGICCVGFILAIVYFLFTQEKSHLETTKQTLVQELTKNAQKQGMFLSIKDRTKIVKRVMVNQKPWAQLLDRVTQIIAPPSLSSISVDDQNKVTITLNASSVDSVLVAVNALIAQAKENKIVNPQLLSFQIGKNGSIESMISFFVVF
jgi:hypothetical protein